MSAMSALGQKQTFAPGMSALPPIATEKADVYGSQKSKTGAGIDQKWELREPSSAPRVRARRSGLGTCGEAAIMKRKVYANVA